MLALLEYNKRCHLWLLWNGKRNVTLACEVNSAYDLQHSMGLEAVCSDTVLPLGWLMCTRNTNLTRVFLRPMSVSPLRSSMSELRSLRIPAQSILKEKGSKAEHKAPISLKKGRQNTDKMIRMISLFHLSKLHASANQEFV